MLVYIEHIKTSQTLAMAHVYEQEYTILSVLWAGYMGEINLPLAS